MNEEELFKQIMDAINKKRTVSIPDLNELIALGIPAGTYASKCASLNEFISEVHYFWQLRRNNNLKRNRDE